MGYVYKDRINRWYICYKSGGKRIAYVVSDFKKNAEKVLRRIQNEIDAGDHNPVEFKAELRGESLTDANKTFGWLVGEFLAGYKGSRRRGLLRTDYYGVRARTWLRHIKADTLLSDMTPARVEDYMDERMATYSISAVLKEVVAMCTMFKWAIRKGLWSDNPAACEKVERPKELKSRSRPLSDEDYDAVTEAAPAWFARIICFGCATGLDRGVVLGNDLGQTPLRWDNLTLRRSGGHIISGKLRHTRPKNRGEIIQVLNPDALAALNETDQVRHPSGIIFLDNAGQPVERNKYEAALKATRAASGVTWFSFRTFRHTFATRAVEAGVHPKVIGELIGDTTTAVIDRYMHTNERLHEEAAAKMSRSVRVVLDNNGVAS